MTAQPPVVAAQSPVSWRTLTPTLWRIYAAYLVVWVLGLVLLIRALQNNASPVLGWSVLFGSVALYVVCMVYAGRIQASLHREGLSKSGATPIIIAGVVLNPVFVGFYVPLSVLLSAGRAARKSR